MATACDLRQRSTSWNDLQSLRKFHMDRILNALTCNWRTDQKGMAIFLCPRLFRRISTYVTSNGIATICPPTLSTSIATMGSILLHEFVHLNVLTFPAAKIRVFDYGLDFWGKKIPKDGLPVDGYGPYNTWVLNNNANKADKQPSLNADSYMWFALESYWSQKCNRDFTRSSPGRCFHASNGRNHKHTGWSGLPAPASSSRSPGSSVRPCGSCAHGSQRCAIRTWRPSA